ADEMNSPMLVEWGANEKVAFEMAVAATFAGARACVAMKQVGLNVAADPYMTTATYRLKGGMLLIAADDPGCHSSQDEQDSRFFAQFARIPVFDPSDAVEARKMVFDAYALSEKYGIIVMLRPTTRVDHCRQSVELEDKVAPGNLVKFEREMSRWIPVPAFARMNISHHYKRIEKIREDFENETGYQQYTFEIPARNKEKLAIIVSGVAFSVVSDFLVSLGRDDISIFKIGTPYPLPYKRLADYISKHDNILILEEPYPVIEDQLIDKSKVKGRWNGWVPREGELLPEIVEAIVMKALDEEVRSTDDSKLKAAIEELKIRPRKPQLCAGCPHRASYFSIRKAYPSSIGTADIGCYALGINQNAIDTCVDMGAAVSTASGLFLAHKVTGQERPIIASIGDSTFFHMGVPGLETAVYNRHAFVLCILDNGTTAMTGGQEHPGTGGKLRKGDIGQMIDSVELCKGCGVKFVEVVNPYDIAAGVSIIKRAWEYASQNQEPAVVIFKYPCMLLRPKQEKIPVEVKESQCTGCKYCMEHFSCPGIVFDDGVKKARIDLRYCISCGVCLNVCPRNSFVAKEVK
ncbi:MAG: indolepyruvate ferredoxin oxidoreductase subunit alpha, partial [Synergistaceae bacterium]|nr:indolepyruvate ferredoxin oxidoreductase subunit alpha [Synergistaceae bacterium]